MSSDRTLFVGWVLVLAVGGGCEHAPLAAVNVAGTPSAAPLADPAVIASGKLSITTASIAGLQQQLDVLLSSNEPPAITCGLDPDCIEIGTDCEDGWPCGSVVATLEMDGRTRFSNHVSRPCAIDVTGDGVPDTDPTLANPVLDGVPCLFAHFNTSPGALLDFDLLPAVADSTSAIGLILAGLEVNYPQFCATNANCVGGAVCSAGQCTDNANQPPRNDQGIPFALPPKVQALLPKETTLKFAVAGPLQVAQHTVHRYDGQPDEYPVGLWLPIEAHAYHEVGNELVRFAPHTTITCDCPPDNASETNCTDGIDNDSDGLIDALDSDCPTDTPAAFADVCENIRQMEIDEIAFLGTKKICEVEGLAGIEAHVSFIRFRFWIGLIPTPTQSDLVDYEYCVPPSSILRSLDAFPEAGGPRDYADNLCLRVRVAGALSMGSAYGPPPYLGSDFVLGGNIVTDDNPGLEFACHLAGCGGIITDQLMSRVRPYVLDGGTNANSAVQSIENGIRPFLTGRDDSLVPGGLLTFLFANAPIDLDAILASAAAGNSADVNAVTLLAQASTARMVGRWWKTPFGPYANGHSFPIADVVPSACPCFPFGDCQNCDGLPRTIDILFDPDIDGDGQLDDVDPFPDCAGPAGFPDHLGNKDTDGDGDADLCDPCPLDPDADGDGVCALQGDACPDVFDPLQGNTNLEFEQANYPVLPPVGDACEPVPQPKLISHEVLDGATVDGFGCGTFVHNTYEIRTLGSADYLGSVTSVPQVPTHVRVCVPNAANNTSCTDAAGGDFLDARVLGDADCAPDLPNQQFATCNPATNQVELPSHPFHRIERLINQHLLEPGTIAAVDLYCSQTNYNFVSNYHYARAFDDDGLGRLFRWCHRASLARMIQQGLLPPSIDPTGSVTGFLWAHADTPVGEQEHGSDLSSDRLPFVTESQGCQGSLDFEIDEGPGFLWKTLPDPPPEFLVAGGAWAEVSPFHTRIVVSTETGYGVLTRSGRLQQPDFLGVVLAARLQDASLRWAQTVEPSVRIGRGPAFPTAFALSTDGSDIVDAVHIAGSQMLADEDRGIDREFVVGSPHADNFVAIASRYRNGVFVIGGVTPGSGLPTGEIWFANVDGARWRRVRTSYRPLQVIAATYSWRTDALYVLDDVGGQARLAAIDFRTGAVEELGRWLRHPVKWDRLFLTLDHDGAVLLTSSSSSKEKHVVARISQAGGGPSTLDGVKKRDGALMLAPIPEPLGTYTFVVRKEKKGNKKKTVLALDEERSLGLHPACWADIGDQL